MKNTADTYIKKFLAQHIERRKFLCVMLMLAVLVSLAVYWRLKYTGIAMTNEVYCGLEEHTHTEDCYENVLVCGFEEGEEVFPSDDTLSGEAVSAGIHTHTDECYEKVLICGLEEHTHTVDCLTDHSLDEDQTNEAETAAETETVSEASSEASVAQTTETDGETEVSSDEPGVISDSSEDSSEEGSSGGGTSGGSVYISETSEDTDEDEDEEQIN
ncbi:MAG: hypothetical protein LIO44_05220 [Eubacterium sp.]|nr:hypothetical protein [Eubacterium sp.]